MSDLKVNKIIGEFPDLLSNNLKVWLTGLKNGEITKEKFFKDLLKTLEPMCDYILKDEIKVFPRTQEDFKILNNYLRKLYFESSLYEKELKRAIERYRETKESIFLLNGVSLSLKELPFIFYKIIFEKKIVSETDSFTGIVPENLTHFKQKILEAENYLKELPGAKERLPKRPEEIDKWLNKI